MYRIIVAMVFAFGMVVGVIGSSPTQSLARQESATPVPTLPTELCTDDQINTWEGEVTVSPSQADDARVQPLDSPDRYLYLVVWTIPPGTCVPYSAGGNMKDGGVVLIVQQGTIEFTAKQFDAGSAAEVMWGHTDGGPQRLDFDAPEPLTLNRGDWVTQNDQVWFTMNSVGSEPAVVLKAVWTTKNEMEGCSGGCK